MIEIYLKNFQYSRNQWTKLVSHLTLYVYPQQAVLISHLQEQHYQQYIKLYQEQLQQQALLQSQQAQAPQVPDQQGSKDDQSEATKDTGTDADNEMSESEEVSEGTT